MGVREKLVEFPTVSTDSRLQDWTAAGISAERPRPAGNRDRRGSVWLQIRCKCSQTAPASGQLRGGNMPSVAMHCVKGNPVAVKMGFAVG
jgi:hypothetical protein